MERRVLRAMGTEVELLVEAEPGVETERALDRAEGEIRRLEGLLSRFIPESELSLLNRRGRLRAGPELVQLTELAFEARARTKGRFDPTIHDALVAAGYDRSFEQVERRSPLPDSPGARCGGGASLDSATGLIELEAGVRLDLGGIAKGYAVDRACSLLAAAGPCAVNAGGDVSVTGRPWPVGVATPAGVLTLELVEGAVATTGRDRRRWWTESGEAHHLIDPATGRPAESDLLRVTAVARTAVEAEVAAKALFLAGAKAAEEEANEKGIPAVLVRADGETVLAGGLS